MARLPPVPPDVVHFAFEIDVADQPSSFGFWVLIPGAGAAGPSYAGALVSSWVTTPMNSFLNCMHTEAIFGTCRLAIGGPLGFSFQERLAPNHGAGTAGQDPCLAAGLYVQTLGGGRGSGSRIHLPGIRNELTTAFYFLSEFGLQQLQFAATALTDWVAGPIGPAGGPGVLGTVRRKAAGVPLAAAQWDPAVFVRPTLELEVLARRQYALRGVSS